MARLSIHKLIGKGYSRGWYTNCSCRYRCYKGARNTKKSYDMLGFEVLCKIMSDPRRNVLILRNTLSSNRYSTFSTLQSIIAMPDVNHPEISLSRYFYVSRNDMTIEYIPTHQLIMFRGMNDPQRLQGIRMPQGYLTDVYVEEAFEITDFEAWRKVDGSIRGKLPKGLHHQVTFCFNAWNKNHWLYEHFFKGRLEDDLDYLLTHDYQDWCDPDLIIDYGKGLYLHTSTYKVNEFRDTEIYDVAMEEMRRKAPEIYKVEALGMWGNSTEATYPEMNDALVRAQSEINTMRFSRYAIGIDFGISDGQGNIRKGKDNRYESATTMQLVAISDDYSKLISVDEYFYSNDGQLVKKTGPELQQELIRKIIEWRDIIYERHPDLMKGVIPVYVDSADSGGFRQGLELEARRQNLYNIAFQGSTKIKIESRVYFTRWLMAYGEYLISANCQNLARELRNARRAENGNCREDFDDHAINASEYAWYPIIGFLKRWKTFKLRPHDCEKKAQFSAIQRN